MAADDELPWPLFGEPATKGDVVAALVGTRVVIVDIYIALRALQQGDTGKLAIALDRLNENDEKLQLMLDRIGGKEPSGG